MSASFIWQDMARTETLKTLLVRILERPLERRPGIALASWLETQEDSRAAKVRKSYDTGEIYFKSYTLCSSHTTCPSVLHLALQFVSQSTAIELACRCAEHVHHVFLREFPQHARPQELIGAIRQWLKGETTKKAVRQVRETMWDLLSEDAGVPSLAEEWDQEKMEAQYLGICAARSATDTAAAIQFPDSSEKWVPIVCNATIEAVSSVNTATAISRCRNFGVTPKRLRASSKVNATAEQHWQRNELLKLLQE